MTKNKLPKIAIQETIKFYKVNVANIFAFSIEKIHIQRIKDKINLNLNNAKIRIFVDGACNQNIRQVSIIVILYILIVNIGLYWFCVLYR